MKLMGLHTPCLVALEVVICIYKFSHIVQAVEIMTALSDSYKQIGAHP